LCPSRNPSPSQTAIDGYRIAPPILRASTVVMFTRQAQRREGKGPCLADAAHLSLFPACRSWVSPLYDGPNVPHRTTRLALRRWSHRTSSAYNFTNVSPIATVTMFPPGTRTVKPDRREMAGLIACSPKVPIWRVGCNSEAYCVPMIRFDFQTAGEGIGPQARWRQTPELCTKHVPQG